MKPRNHLIVVQLITTSRVGASLAFSVIAFQPALRSLAIILFLYALIADVADGYFARRFQVTSAIGGALDGSGDKYQTVVSVLYLAAHRFSLSACATLLLRDVITAGLRAVHVDGTPLLPIRKWMGGVVGIPVKLLTLSILLHPEMTRTLRAEINIGLWCAAVIAVAILMWSLWTERVRVRQGLNNFGAENGSPRENTPR